MEYCTCNRNGMPEDGIVHPTTCPKARSVPSLQERVAELRAWAKSRIAECDREVEARVQWQEIAAQERRTLQAVLRILDGEGKP